MEHATSHKNGLFARLRKGAETLRNTWSKFSLAHDEVAGGILAVTIIGGVIMGLAAAMAPLYGMAPVLYTAAVTTGFAGLVVSLAHHDDTSNKAEETHWQNMRGQSVTSTVYAKNKLEDAEKKLAALFNAEKGAKKTAAASTRITREHARLANSAKVKGDSYKFPMSKRDVAAWEDRKRKEQMNRGP